MGCFDVQSHLIASFTSYMAQFMKWIAMAICWDVYKYLSAQIIVNPATTAQYSAYLLRLRCGGVDAERVAICHFNASPFHTT